LFAGVAIEDLGICGATGFFVDFEAGVGSETLAADLAGAGAAFVGGSGTMFWGGTKSTAV
jgi:hypothetical protein